MVLTPAHVRAARALLHITQGELAVMASVSPTTVRSFELGKGIATEDTCRRLHDALYARGVRFFNGGSPGVRLVDAPTQNEQPSCEKEL